MAVPSVSESWPMARNIEEEIQDLFGIDFGHKRPPGRGLLPAGWRGFPMRKSYAFPTEFADIMHMRPAGQTGGMGSVHERA